MKKTARIRDFLEPLLIITASVALFLFIFGYLARPFRVEGMSMEPIYHNGDLVLVRRFHDEPRVNRGDIVVLEAPGGGFALKRAVAVGGDEVRFSGGRIFVNGVNGGRIDLGEVDMSFDDNPFTIEDGRVFLLGDNRGVSLDSRIWGAIPVSRLYGKVVHGSIAFHGTERKAE